MKKWILLIIWFPFIACNHQNNFSKTEISLLQKLDFDITLFSEIKKIFPDSELVQLPLIDDKASTVSFAFAKGIYVEANENQAFGFILNHKNLFYNKGYLLFVFEEENKTKGIAVIKGNNELDIIRYRKTNVPKYNITNADIVAQIDEWHTLYGVLVLGCGQNCLQIQLNTIPNDLNPLVYEMYHFCPNVLDQGAGDFDYLKSIIRNKQPIWLWWD